MGVDSKFYGRTNYQESLKIQEDFVARVKADESFGAVLGFEFEPVITLGIRGSEGVDLVAPQGIPVVRVPRGGQATLHSPGQIVIYPVCNITFHEHGLREWTAAILGSSRTVVGKFGKGVRCSDIGLYLGEAKVASLGLKMVGRVSTFGIAINLRNDVGLFSSIRPCGISGQAIGTLGFEGELSEFFEEWVAEFRRRLSR